MKFKSGGLITSSYVNNDEDKLSNTSSVRMNEELLKEVEAEGNKDKVELEFELTEE
jgi:hypothetical protein